MKTDFCVIGGGIAGLSIAAELSGHASVVVVEREKDLAYHTSGRSAALYSELVAGSTSLALSKLSREFLVNPPAGFSDYPLHKPIGCIFTARASELEHIEMEAGKLEQPQRMDIEEMLAAVPILRTGGEDIVAGLFEAGAFRIDVGGLIQGYRKQVKRQGGTILCEAEVVALQQQAAGWQIQLANKEQIEATTVVNAAGAWGDVLAGLAGVKPLGLMPRRRNIIVFDGPAETKVDAWPAVGSITAEYYFLPEAGKLMGSSADEVPSEPCDAQAEEYDIALAAYNIEAATTLEIKQIHHKWAGLRTFAPDRQVVAGYDTGKTGFFWYVGQGGFGIQTAPAAAHAAALLARHQALPEAYRAAGLSAEQLSPARFSGN